MEIFIRLDRLPISELLSCRLWERSFTAESTQWLEKHKSEDLHDVNMYIMTTSPDICTVVAVECKETCIGTKDVLGRLRASKPLEYKFENFDEKKDENRGFSFKLKFAEWESQTHMSALWRRSFERKKPSSEQGATTHSVDLSQIELRASRAINTAQEFSTRTFRIDPSQFTAIYSSPSSFSDPFGAPTPTRQGSEGSEGQPRQSAGPRLQNETDAEWSRRTRESFDAFVARMETSQRPQRR